MSPNSTEQTPYSSKSEKVLATRATPTDLYAVPLFSVMVCGVKLRNVISSHNFVSLVFETQQ